MSNKFNVADALLAVAGIAIATNLLFSGERYTEPSVEADHESELSTLPLTHLGTCRDLSRKFLEKTTPTGQTVCGRAHTFIQESKQLKACYLEVAENLEDMSESDDMWMISALESAMAEQENIDFLESKLDLLCSIK